MFSWNKKLKSHSQKLRLEFDDSLEELLVVLDDASLSEWLDLHAFLEGPLWQVLLWFVQDVEEALSIILFREATVYSLQFIEAVLLF